MSIFLIGLPGCGKSTLGALLAARLGKPFCDMDCWIEQSAGCSIPDLFQQGEGVFRDWESRAVGALSGRDMVVACGGGVVLRAENRAALRKGGLVLWIDRPVKNILSDIDVSLRPLLAGGSGELLRLEKERRGLYAQTAHARVENAGDIEEALKELLDAIDLKI